MFRKVCSSHLLLFYFLSLILFVQACGPEIKVFDATPSRLCKGDSTTITWEIDRDKSGILSSSLIDDLTIPNMSVSVDKEGSKRFELYEDTRFKITAHKDEHVYSEYDVLVYNVRGEKDFGETAKQDTTKADVMLAVFSPRKEKWPDKLRVDTVSSTFQRELTVIHENHQIILPSDGTPSDELRGSKVNGEWIIKTQLMPDEKSDRPPDTLAVTISFYCESEAGG